MPRQTRSPKKETQKKPPPPQLSSDDLKKLENALKAAEAEHGRHVAWEWNDDETGLIPIDN